MSAVKSGATPAVGTITISGTGNTLTSIASDINDTAWAELVGSVLTIKCRYIQLNADGDLTIGNVNDYSVSETLRHLFTGTNGQNRLYTYIGSTLNIYGNCIVDLGYNCTSAQYPDYSYFGGLLKMVGNDTYKPKMIGARRFYVGYLPYESNFSEARHLITGVYLKKCIIGGCYANYPLAFYDYGVMPTIMVMEDIIFTLGIYTTTMQYPVGKISNPDRPWYFPTPMINPSAETTNAYLVLQGNMAGMWFKNINWVSSHTAYVIQSGISNAGHNNFGIVQNPGLEYLYSDLQLQQLKYGQPFDLCFDNIQVTTGNATYVCYIYYGARVLVMNSTAQTSNKKWLAYSGGSYWFWNSDDCYAYPMLDRQGSNVRRVFRLALTVNDLSGNPIDNAFVKIKQKDGNEEFNFITGADGKILSPYDIAGALLTNKIKLQSAGTAGTGTEYTWSDASNSTYHTVTVLKEGYKAETFNVVMDQDRIQTVQLKSLNKMYIGITEITGIGV